MYRVSSCSVQVPFGRLMESVVYGFLNCKTYYFILLPCIFGLEIPLAPWLIEAVCWAVDNEQYWQVLFYHAHRMHLRSSPQVRSGPDLVFSLWVSRLKHRI